MLLSELPSELIFEIYKWLFDTTTIDELQKDILVQREWSLNILTVCTICKSWYKVGTYYITKHISPITKKQQQPFQFLLQTIETPCINKNELLLPQQPTWFNLLTNSKKNHLDLHLKVKTLVLNLSLMFNRKTSPIPRRKLPSKKGKNSLLEGSLLKTITTLLELCPNINKLEIIYDAKYSPKLENDESYLFMKELSNELVSILTKHAKQHHQHDHPSILKNKTLINQHCVYLNQLVVKSNEIDRRCPCCIGKGWDHFLNPILKALPLKVLEMNQILPSRTVLESISEKNQIHTMIIRGDILIQISRFARYGTSISSPPRIPMALLMNIRTLEIYLQDDDVDNNNNNSNNNNKVDNNSNSNNNNNHHHDDDELDLLVTFRQVYDLIHPMNSLQKLIIHGYLNPLTPKTSSTSPINAHVWLKLQHLSEKCQLDTLILENLPGFQCNNIQSRLQGLFLGVKNLNIVYT
ncbi:unnamed protein product [Cunninghamella blakesleeana]